MDKVNKKWIIVDFSVPWDANVKTKEDDKIARYIELATEIRRLYKVRTEIIPIVVGALGTIPKRLQGYLKSLGVPDVIGCLQTTALLGTQRILKSTFSISCIPVCVYIFCVCVIVLYCLNGIWGGIVITDLSLIALFELSFYLGALPL